MRKRKIRAKVVFFRELWEICVKKSDVFGRDGEKTESKSANILRFLQFWPKKILRFLHILEEKILRKLQILYQYIDIQ